MPTAAVTQRALEEARNRPISKTMRLAVCMHFKGELARGEAASTIDFTRGQDMYIVRVVSRQRVATRVRMSEAKIAATAATHLTVVVLDDGRPDAAYVMPISVMHDRASVSKDHAGHPTRELFLTSKLEAYRDHALESYLSRVY